LKKRYKIFLTFCGIIAIVIVIGIPVLYSSPFQTWAAQELSSYYSKKLGTKIKIEKLHFRLFNTVSLSNLLITDKIGDSLFYTKEFKVNISSFRLSNNYLRLSEISIAKPKANISYDTAGVSNFQFIIDEFASTDSTQIDTVQTNSTFEIEVDKLKITNASLVFEQQTDSVLNLPKNVFNPNLIKIKDLNLLISNIESSTTNNSLEINSFSFNESSGLSLKNLVMKVQVEENKIHISDFILQTPKSKIELAKLKVIDFADSTRGFPKFSVQILEGSHVSAQEFAYIDTSFNSLTEKIYFSGDIFGSQKRLIVNKLNITSGNYTSLTMNGGLIDVNSPELKYYLAIKELKTTRDAIATNSFNSEKFFKFEIPSELPGLEEVSLEAEIYGDLKSAELSGLLKTNIGSTLFEAGYEQDTIKNTMNVYADLNTLNINIGQLTGKKELGEVAFSLNSTANLINNELSVAKADLNISKADYNGYRFSGIHINTSLFEKEIETSLVINDQNILLDIPKVSYNFKEKLPSYFIKGDLKFANLDIILNDTSNVASTISGEFFANIKGDNIDNIAGNFGLLNASMLTKTEYIPVKSFIFHTEHSNTERVYKLNSDYLDLDLRGNLSLNQFAPAFTEMLRNYLPDIIIEADTSYKKVDKEQQIALTANFKNLDKINRNFFSDIHISEGTHIIATLKTKNTDSDFNLEISIPEITAYDNTFKDFSLSSNTQNGNLSADIDFSAELMNKDIILETFIIRSNILDNKINNLISWQNNDTSSVYGGSINPETTLFMVDSVIQTKTIFQKTEVAVANMLWEVESRAIELIQNKIKISDMKFTNEDQLIWINGNVSPSPKDILTLEISNLRLNKINEFLDNPEFIVDGRFNGRADAMNLFTEPILNVIGSFRNLSANTIPFGNVSFAMMQDTIMNTINLELDALDTRNQFSLGGIITENDEMFMNLFIEHIDFKVAEPFMGKGIRVQNGYLSGDCAIGGKIDSPQWNGFLKLDSVNLALDFLGVSFGIDSNIEVGSNQLKISKTNISDKEGNLARFSALMNHENFNDMSFEIEFETGKFLVLDTNSETEEIYYGSLYSSGYADISGTPEKFAVKAELGTLEGSALTLIAEDGELSENTDIFTFKSDTSVIVEPEKKKITGLDLDFHLNISEGTEFKVIIDQATNNYLTATGLADLDFKADYLGNIGMSGSYTINKGLYHFSAGNLYTMDFHIKKGSNIKWNGAPDAAIADITTYYKIKKADIYPLMFDVQDKDKTLPARCNIDIMEPKVSFGVEFEKEDSRLSSILRNLPEDQMNKQFLSMLTMQKFTPLPGMIESDNTEDGGINAAEILSGQLGSVISMFSDNVDIGLNYKQGQGNEEDQYGVDFSTQFFNDRVTINGNVAKNNSETYATDIIGDFDAELKVTADGQIKMRAFNKTNKTTVYSTGPYTQGVGFFYRKEFDALIRREKKNIKQKEIKSAE